MDGQLFRIASGTTEGTITGGGYSFDEPTMRGLITDWLDIAFAYQQSLDNSENIARVKPPGLDYASAAQADASNASGRAYLAYLEHNKNYCFDQAQLCQNALDDYLGIEHRNVREINQSGGPVDDSPRPKV